MTTAIERSFPQVWMAALFLAILLLSSTASAADKVAICHLPPGNPENRQTIFVAPRAVSAHLAHGDTLGACASGCQADSACDDENPCTSDVCLSDGSCSHTSVDCNDSIVCTQDSCDVELGGCVYVATCQNAECDDGNACTTPDTCEDGICKGTSIPGCCTTDADCSDSDPCTVDVCGTGNSCFNNPKICPEIDECNTGFCDPETGECGGAPISCDDDNICTTDSCDPEAGCQNVFSADNATEPGTEITCDDGLDNDCDGDKDSNDSDCPDCSECDNCAGTHLGDDGVCVIDQCVSGFANCDTLFDNGCETNLATDANNCGNCATVCDPNSTCAGGACVGQECTDGETRPCGSDEGICESGTQTCQNSTWGACVGQTFPQPEICNGQDDDCDGTCDNGFTCCQGETRECTTACDTTGTQSCNGSCEFGVCNPPAEICDDGIDNDCDGSTDASDSDCSNVSSGVYLITPTIAYTCAAGLVQDSVNAFTLSVLSASSIIVAGDNLDTNLTGTINGSNFQASGSIAGTVSKTYFVQGTFVDADHWGGTFSLTFSPNQLGCTDQSWDFQATRAP